MLFKLFKTILVSVSLLGTIIVTPNLQSAELKTDDGYIIHYNALNTTLVPVEVARSYNIVRSKTRGMLTVVILKAPMADKPGLPHSVTAKVTAQVVNLNQQLQTLEMRHLQDGDATYYVDVFSFTNEDTLDFTITVQPESQGKVQKITFRQQFFVD